MRATIRSPWTTIRGAALVHQETNILQSRILAVAPQNWAQGAAKKNGCNKGLAWHTFRRSVATLLGQAGEDVKAVQELMRHPSSRITQDVYQQANQTARREALK